MERFYQEQTLSIQDLFHKPWFDYLALQKFFVTLRKYVSRCSHSAFGFSIWFASISLYEVLNHNSKKIERFCLHSLKKIMVIEDKVTRLFAWRLEKGLLKKLIWWLVNNILLRFYYLKKKQGFAVRFEREEIKPNALRNYLGNVFP